MERRGKVKLTILKDNDIIEKETTKLYNLLIDTLKLDTYVLDFPSFMAQTITKEIKPQEVHTVIDKTLKRFLKELKEIVNRDKYENVVMNMGLYKDQEAYDMSVGIIKYYYDCDFIVGDKELDTISVIISLIEQENVKDINRATKLVTGIIACILKFHYALYINRTKKNS